MLLCCVPYASQPTFRFGFGARTKISKNTAEQKNRVGRFTCVQRSSQPVCLYSSCASPDSGPTQRHVHIWCLDVLLIIIVEYWYETKERGMEEQFILRVPPAVAERIELLLNDSSSSEDKSLDLSFSDNGRTGTFVIGNDRFSASLLDLPTVVESYKTYDDNVLIKTADVGQMVMVREGGDTDSVPEALEYRHGLTPPMRDARRRRFRREPDLNPEVVRRVEKDLQNIMAGGTAENIAVEMAEPEKFGDEATRNGGKNVFSTPSAKPDVPNSGMVGAEPDPDGSDSDDAETDDSI